MFEVLPKLSMGLTEFCGDYYYKPIPRETIIEHHMNPITDPNLMCYSLEDICRYAEDNANEKFPLDGPLWTAKFQEVFIDEDGKTKSLVFWKNHHAMGDGISMMSCMLGASADYDRSYFIPMPDATWWQELLVKLVVPFMIPKLLLQTFF